MCPNRPILTSGTQSYCRPYQCDLFLFLSKDAMQLSLHKGRAWHKLSLSFNISCWHSPLPKKWLFEVPSICPLKKKATRFFPPNPNVRMKEENYQGKEVAAVHTG